ncbi:unnamed protein product [Blepharisma stoltei]|uniref:Uncharacterized protein n=1 Tax=Blepharisma stoltei TaxID=1481888 RepID=A0AAU9IE94_9CILI|nr:unnamed protein product [Blepharisma stoltei]
MWNSLACNTIYGKFLREKEAQRYHRSLSSVRSVMNTHKAPKEMRHLQYKAKRIRLIQDRNEEIEHQNQLLLNKMYNIDSKPSSLNPNNCAPRSPSITNLNSKVRSRNLSRIYDENKKFLERLQNAESAYSIEKWDEEERRRNYLKENISKNSGRCFRKNKVIQDWESQDLISKILSRRQSRPITAEQAL